MGWQVGGQVDEQRGKRSEIMRQNYGRAGGQEKTGKKPYYG